MYITALLGVCLDKSGISLLFFNFFTPVVVYSKQETGWHHPRIHASPPAGLPWLAFAALVPVSTQWQREITS